MLATNDEQKCSKHWAENKELKKTQQVARHCSSATIIIASYYCKVEHSSWI